MAANKAHIVSYEALASQLAADLEAVWIQSRFLLENRWSDATGQGWEPVYNAGGIGPNDTVPDSDGVITQSEMNNFIASLTDLVAEFEDHGGPLAKVAAYLTPPSE